MEGGGGESVKSKTFWESKLHPVLFGCESATLRCVGEVLHYIVYHKQM